MLKNLEAAEKNIKYLFLNVHLCNFLKVVCNYL